jgi:hypothetical protein
MDRRESEKIKRDTQTHREQGDFISLLYTTRAAYETKQLGRGTHGQTAR